MAFFSFSFLYIQTCIFHSYLYTATKEFEIHADKKSLGHFPTVSGYISECTENSCGYHCFES